MLDLVVIGGGPAGLGAALEAAGAGLSVTLVDENASLGGQIYRGLDSGGAANSAVLGKDYLAGRPLIEAVKTSGATLQLQSTVWAIEVHGNGFSVAVTQVGPAGSRQVQQLACRTVLIATGALERPFPIPGWTLPGVMTAGAGQTMLKASGLVPEGPTVLAGTGPLLFLLASQYRRAGLSLAGLLLTTPSGNIGPAMPHAAPFLASPYAWKGAGLLASLMSRVPIFNGVIDLAAEGGDRLEAVSFTAGGRQWRIGASTLLLHQGVVPQVSLAMAAGCAHKWNPIRLAFEPELDDFGQSSVRGLFIAGDGAGIGGAAAAAAAGRLSGQHIAGMLKGTANNGLAAALRRTLRHHLRGRAFLDRLYRPADAARVPADEVTVCRCEGVTAGAIRAACARGATGPNQVKIFTRAGMGPCQGRLCGLTVSEIVAETTGVSMGDVGHARLRFPTKPVTVGELADLHRPPEGEKSRHGRLF